MKPIALLALPLVLVVAEPSALAQRPLFGAFLEGGSGVEAGGGSGFSVVQRARTLARVGVTMSVDEMPDEVFSVAVLSDLEPTIALGVDGQWGHWVSKHFLFEAGPVAYLAPQTLFGVTGGVRYRIPIGSKFSLMAGLSLTGFFAGSDLPDNTALVTGLLVLGMHASL